MATYSKAHEREESTKMWKGFWHSTFGIVFCWVPLLGLILSISGFARQAVRITGKHKARLALFVIYGLASLALSIGIIVGGLYQYSRDPQMPQKVLQQVWTGLTGQATLPGQSTAYNYGTSENPGFGVYTDPNDPDTQMQPEDFADDEFFPEDEEFGDEEFVDEEFEDTMPDDTFIEGDAVPDDVVGSEIPSVGDMRAASLGGDSAEFVDPLKDESSEEDDTEEDFGGIDFGYEVVEDPTTEVEGLVQVDYKVAIDKEDPTEEELENLFYEVILDDGYDLHNIAVYRDTSETNGDYTVAVINEGTPGADPTITMK